MRAWLKHNPVKARWPRPARWTAPLDWIVQFGRNWPGWHWPMTCSKDLILCPTPDVAVVSAPRKINGQWRRSARLNYDKYDIIRFRVTNSVGAIWCVSQRHYTRGKRGLMRDLLTQRRKDIKAVGGGPANKWPRPNGPGNNVNGRRKRHKHGAWWSAPGAGGRDPRPPHQMAARF